MTSLMVSKFHNSVKDPIGQENKIYTIMKSERRSTAATMDFHTLQSSIYIGTTGSLLANTIHHKALSDVFVNIN